MGDMSTNTVGYVRDVADPNKTTVGWLPEDAQTADTVGHVRVPT